MINYGSMLTMKVAKVSPDINDHTMGLPEAILKILNADLRQGLRHGNMSKKTSLICGDELAS